MRIARTHLRLHRLAAAMALLGVVAAVGCGLGPGEAADGAATLTVTRDFGAEELVEATTTDPTPTETVARFLDREAEIETSFGGNFINSINGIENRAAGSSQQDWFFYVNGYWSPVGAAEAEVRPGDRIWWDYREWTGAYRVGAVVGSFPEPFAHGEGDEQVPTRLDCRADEPICEEVASRLTDADAELVGPDGRVDSIRVLVGEIDRLEGDPAVRLLGRGPEASGVYAKPIDCEGGPRLQLLDELANPAAELKDFGLIAATQRADRQPTWIITGPDAAAVAAAVESLDRDALADRYALALDGGEAVAVPAAPAGTDLEKCD